MMMVMMVMMMVMCDDGRDCGGDNGVILLFQKP